MRLYLAGPMTGHKDFNFPAFMRYAELLREKGHEVVNPAEESLKLHGIEWKGSLTIAETEALASTPWEEYLQKDLEAIDTVEAVAILPGWDMSKGATREVNHALDNGKPLYHAVMLASTDPATTEMALYTGLVSQTIEERTVTETFVGEMGETSEGFEFYADNPERQRAITGAVKDNRSKARVDLIPSSALIGASVVLGYGANKYKPHNWRLGLSWTQTFASLQRHLLAFNDGEDIDPESGLPHIDHAMCQLLFLSHYFHTGEGEDDRFTSADPAEARA